jgi:hypothetical protein
MTANPTWDQRVQLSRGETYWEWERPDTGVYLSMDIRGGCYPSRLVDLLPELD